jgi:drug/metabolite transporter (DMT)-like permease
MKKEYLYAGVSIFCWSTVAVVTKLLLQDLNQFQLLWASSFFAGLFLLVVNLVTGNLKQLKQWKLKDFAISALCGIPGTFLYYVFYYAGAARMEASHAFIVNYLWPIMSVVFACVILKEKLTFKKVLAIGVSFVGVGIVSFSKLSSFSTDLVVGTVLCMLGAVCYGIFTALNRKVQYDKRLSMMINYAVTFLLTTVINGCRGDLFLPNGAQALGMAWNGMFTMAAAGTLWILALQRGKTEKISNLAYITPFLSLVWTTLFLHEAFDPMSILGLTVIVTGILIQFDRRKKA